MEGASDAQYARKKELMRKKAACKRRFPAINNGVMRAKINLDAAIKWYQEEKGYKGKEQAKYGVILKEIEDTPAELDDWYQEGGEGVQQVAGGGNGN